MYLLVSHIPSKGSLFLLHCLELFPQKRVCCNLFYLLLAVLLENFSIFYNDEETNLDLETMKDFKRKWRIFDLHARVIIITVQL